MMPIFQAFMSGASDAAFSTQGATVLGVSDAKHPLNLSKDAQRVAVGTDSVVRRALGPSTNSAAILSSDRVTLCASRQDSRVAELRQDAAQLQQEAYKHSREAVVSALDGKPGTALSNVYDANRKDWQAAMKTAEANRLENSGSTQRGDGGTMPDRPDRDK